MKILVCVKEVPDLEPETELKISNSGKWFEADESVRYMMNRFDEFAIEEALLIKEKRSGVEVDVLTVGPERSHQVIRRALGMGADHGIHLISEQQEYQDPYLVSYLVAQIVEKKAYDLVLTGVMSEDLQQGQTGIMIAEHANLPCASSVMALEFAESEVYVEREIEGGFREHLQIQLPCVLTMQSGINQPRYPALSKVLKAKKAELETYPVSDFEQASSKQEIKEVSYPDLQRVGEILEGSPGEKAERLIRLLIEKSFLV